ncbi:hypothetical protein JR316_0009361 [Psilocybe cubensis]|uniref:Uncharacterized protein n=2 Tax=Psilocybe cubensis TaxID=181762 RepID=A0ACB8GTI7_PSICU|nr:hypothetical protein JR316_0009361 [Psilocybe cubensis]KAH9478899.1 hypothetical protein JR316_0009361 [Psilocybe cubensis]
MSNSSVSESSPTVDKNTSEYQRPEQTVYEDTGNVQKNPTLDLFESSGWNEVRVDGDDYQLFETYLNFTEIPSNTSNNTDAVSGTPPQEVPQSQGLHSQSSSFFHHNHPSSAAESYSPGHIQPWDNSSQNLSLEVSVYSPNLPEHIPQAPQDALQNVYRPYGFMSLNRSADSGSMQEVTVFSRATQDAADNVPEIHATGTINPALLALPARGRHLPGSPRYEIDPVLISHPAYESVKRRFVESVPRSGDQERNDTTQPYEQFHPTRFQHPSGETETQTYSIFQHMEYSEANGSGYNPVEQSTSRRDGSKRARSRSTTPIRETGGSTSNETGSSSARTRKRRRTARDGNNAQTPVSAKFEDESTIAVRPQRRGRAADNVPLRPRTVVQRLDFVTGKIMSQGKRTDQTEEKISSVKVSR